MQIAFATPSPIRNGRNAFFASAYLLPARCLPVAARQHVASRAAIRAQWQKYFLPPDASIPSLDILQTSFPKHVHLAFLLGIDAEKKTAFITMHEKLATRRPPHATSSFALPLPLPIPAHKACLLLNDVFKHVYATPMASSEPLIANDASFVTSLLPVALCRHLSIDHISANQLASDLKLSSNPLCNRAAVILSLLRTANARIAAAALLEAPSTTSNELHLQGVLYVEQCIASLYNERVFSGPVPVLVDPHFAVALANAVGCSCLLQTDTFHDASVRINHMDSTFASCGRNVVDCASVCPDLPDCDPENDEYGESDPALAPKLGAMPKEIWGMTAADILDLSDEQLRSSLRSQNVAVLRKESRESLLGKIVEFMDEVQRRELGIVLAAQQEMYGLAAELQKGRSVRGRLLTELREAEKRGAWEDVVDLAAELKLIERQTHDITAEPGTYDRNLDQDDWYRPTR